ncbi:hypothetical protein CEXT_161971 [Caerostris extrusa]|uniref:Uncharacterized protein n=1 Tax=Caerostris extrusa TaxID=172846 RepID=A0AAV4NQX4_CAEEX|nr:hypothetical protein CEXT_161971 [Caerostris extrusa]
MRGRNKAGHESRCMGQITPSILGYFSGCLYQSWSFLDIYFKYPTTMEVSVEQAPVLQFPAVTICNGNRIGRYFNYEYTNCFSINARWANRSAELFSASMFRPRSGRSSELSIMLNLERNRYSPMNPVVRARMTIHAADTIPNPQYDGVSLQPGIDL